MFHTLLHGGGERDRTDDLLLAKQALSQLSYTPEVVGLSGVEPLTSRLSGARSDQLSYRPAWSLAYSQSGRVRNLSKKCVARSSGHEALKTPVPFV
jgi:hypothetical protein